MLIPGFFFASQVSSPVFSYRTYLTCGEDEKYRLLGPPRRDSDSTGFEWWWEGEVQKTFVFLPQVFLVPDQDEGPPLWSQSHWFFSGDMIWSCWPIWNLTDTSTLVLSLKVHFSPICFFSLASVLSTLEGVIYIDILVWYKRKVFLVRMPPAGFSLVTKIPLSLWCCCHLAAQSCPTLWPTDCSPPGSSVHGIFQEAILEWVAIYSSRGMSPLRNWTCVSCFSYISWQIFFFLPLSHKGRPFSLGYMVHTYTYIYGGSLVISNSL